MPISASLNANCRGKSVTIHAFGTKRAKGAFHRTLDASSYSRKQRSCRWAAGNVCARHGQLAGEARPDAPRCVRRCAPVTSGARGVREAPERSARNVILLSADSGRAKDQELPLRTRRKPMREVVRIRNDSTHVRGGPFTYEVDLFAATNFNFAL